MRSEPIGCISRRNQALFAATEIARFASPAIPATRKLSVFVGFSDLTHRGAREKDSNPRSPARETTLRDCLLIEEGRLRRTSHQKTVGSKGDPI